MRKAAPSAPLSPDDADSRESLEQDNGRNHGYDNNRHGCKNPIHQPVHRIVFNIVFHVSFSSAIHARRTEMPTAPNEESVLLARHPFGRSGQKCSFFGELILTLAKERSALRAYLFA